MPKGEVLLAIDLGAESGRAVVGRFDGAKLEIEETHRFPNQPVEISNTLYWDVLGLYANIERAIEQIAASGSVRSVGIDTWGVDFGLLDSKGQLIANPVHYRDRRTEGMMQRAYEIVPREDIYRATGNMFLELNTFFQLLALRLSDDPTLTCADRMLNIPDLLHYWLSGAMAHELSIASTTQCMAANRKEWAWDLLRKFDIPKCLFGEIVPSGTNLGPMRKNNKINVITPASHDTGSAVMAVPGSGDDILWISSGTWSVVGILTDLPVVSLEALEQNFSNEAAGDGRNRFSRNVMGLWILQECRREWEREGKSYSYSELVELAKQSLALVSVINPDDQRFLRPGRMRQAVQEYCAETNQPIPQSVGEITRCIFESLALAYRSVLEWIEKETGRNIKWIHIVGGGSKNTLLCQLTADACDKEVVGGPFEATAIGNLLSQAMSLGLIASAEESIEVVKNSFPVDEYTPKTDERWDKNFKMFKGFG